MTEQISTPERPVNKTDDKIQFLRKKRSIVMRHFQAGSLEAAFDIEALVELGAIENSLPGIISKATPNNKKSTNK